jgi:osmotically-inducible protein OsmY
MIIKISRFIFFVGGLATLIPTGCMSPIMGVGTMAVTASQQERGMVVATTDLAAQANAQTLFLKKNLALWSDVTITVVEGRLLLTGTVDTDLKREEASRIAKRAAGVKTVLNELQVTQEPRDRISDWLLKIKIQDRLLRDPSILSINYSLEVVNKAVYLIGTSQSTQELSRVRAHLRDIKKVRTLVDHVLIKD